MSDTQAAGVSGELDRIAQAGLLRRLRTLDSAQGCLVEVAGRHLVNFSSNDYLGLANCAELKAAMTEGVQRFGVGAGASRLVCGNLSPHAALEETLAQFKSTEAALAFSSGYATALGVIPALCGKNDFVILDKLSHASLIDATKLSGATLRVFPHNNTERLAHLLQTIRTHHGAQARILVATESVFSMDGDLAPLEGIVALTEAHEALLMVDEAHAVGVLGPQGRGLVAALGLEKRVALQMGTLSKALGVSGGYIAASRSFVDLLINKARSLIYSTAPPPAIAFAAKAAVDLVKGSGGDARRQRLLENLALVQEAPAVRHFLPAPSSSSVHPTGQSAILPLMMGDESSAMRAGEALLQAGFLVPAIRYPTVARGRARLRLTLGALHEAVQIKGLVTGLERLMAELPPPAPPTVEKGTD